MSECNNCDKYDYQTHSCPIFCDVIRNTLEDVRADENEKVLDEAIENIIPALYESNVDEETINTCKRLFEQMKGVRNESI